MKKSLLLFLLALSLVSFQTNEIPIWPTNVNKTIATLKPKFRTTSTKFSLIPIKDSEIGGSTGLERDSCQNLEPFATEIYRKTISLTGQADNKNFYIKLEVIVTESPELADSLSRAIGKLRWRRVGTDNCPQSIIEKKPTYTFIYRNTLMVLIARRFQNYETFREYAIAFEEALKKQQ